jgi:hypothetical protein
MTSARVIAGFAASRAYEEYTIERAGPLPNVIQRSHAAVAVVHGLCAIAVEAIASEAIREILRMSL